MPTTQAGSHTVYYDDLGTLLGTDITRRFGEMMCGGPRVVTDDEASLLGGMYRVILLTKA